MIYFFDNELNMIKVATSKNVISAVHEHELNGLILGTVETDLSYTEAFINDVDYFGYYYKDNYHLHKIKRVEHEHENELVRITGRHIFFEDMLYGDYIRDVRPENRDALYILNRTISANTRWQTVMTDTSKLHSETYYWVPPMEVLNDLTENVGIEYEPKILFDGQNINGFQLHVANRIGEDTPIRVPFGSRVLNLKYEVDYSEIVTALYGHGKGEEVGDGYGRRINFSSVNFSRNGVVSPSGQLYMENPSVTDQYGKDDGSPKFGRIIFEDIESASELANATYEAYLEQSRPKMLFEASVVDLGDVGMGDGVLIIRREYDVYFNARIHKLMVDLLDAENADVELGDYAHFKESKVQRKTRENNNQYRRETSSRIQQLKEQFNDRFDGEVNQMREDFEQALIDAHAEIQAAEVRMEALISTTRNDWTDTFEAEVAEIYRKADEDYNRIEAEITGVIDSTREEMEDAFNTEVQAAKDLAEQRIADAEQRINTTIDTTSDEMEQGYNQAVISAREYAEQQATEKADAVRTDLETVTSGHQSMLDDLELNVMDIDDFLGSARDITLDERLQRMNLDFIEEINNINLNTANMLQGTNFDEPDKINLYSNTDLLDRGDYYVIRVGRPGGNEGANTSSFMMTEPVYIEANKDYFLYIEYRSFSTPELDYLTIATESGFFELYDADKLTEGFTNLTTDGSWRRAKIRINTNTDREGQIRIGSRWNRGEGGVWIETRRPYLTDTNNDRWLPHPMDATQSIEQISRRITELEDGRRELITRTEYDLDTGQINQVVRDIEETVDTSRNLIQEIQDLDIILRGSEAIQTIEGFEDKVWLNDFSEIGANLIPQSENAWENEEYYTSGNDNVNGIGIRLKRNQSISVVEGESYAFSCESLYVSGIQRWYVIVFKDGNQVHHENINRGDSKVFTVHGDEVLINANGLPGFGARPDFIEHLDNRIQIKLERGSSATPFMNALSRVEQLADKYSVQVAELDGTYLKQSELVITPDYAQIGSMRIDGDTVGSMLRVSPDGIDAVAEAMRLSGDLYVDGEITALAISAVEGNFSSLIVSNLETNKLRARHINANAIGSDHLYVTNAMIEKLIANSVLTDEMTARSIEAIEGNFAKLWADEFRAITIDADDINGLTARFEWLYTLNANIEKLVAQNVFADGVTALVGNFVEVNAGNIVTSGLSANVIMSSHINSSNALINKIFSSSARIDTLVSKTHFVNEINALSLSAVHGDISNLRTKLLTANVITSNHIKVENALIDKMFASTALIGRLTSKSAFIRDIQAIEITANQLNINTLQNKLGSVEGGLHIYGPDGRVLINNSIMPNRFDVQFIQPHFMSPGVTTSGNYFKTTNTSYTTAAAFSFFQAGRYLTIEGYCEMRGEVSGASRNTIGAIRLMEYSGGSRNSFVYINSRNDNNDNNQYYDITLDLGVPQYRQRNFYVQFYTANPQSAAHFRINQAYYHG